MFDDFKTKDSVSISYTGDGKGKTSASLGLMLRALGAGKKVAYIQFIKHWEVSEHKFINQLIDNNHDLFFFKGGEGFYHAGELSAKDVTDNQHKDAAEETLEVALNKATSGDYDLVICDEINNAVNDGLLSVDALKDLLNKRTAATSICFTGRNYPKELIPQTDIVTEMKKLRHHFDDKFIANEGIDY